MARAGRWLPSIFAVYGIRRRPLGDVGDVDIDLEQIVEVAARSPEDCPEIVQAAPRLSFDAAGLHGGHVGTAAELPRDIKRPIEHHAMRVVTVGGWKFGYAHRLYPGHHPLIRSQVAAIPLLGPSITK